jgi:MFS family permease
MASQGIAPLIWMPLCDYFGRRLTLIATLVVFVGANAGLLFAKKISSLMLLRAAQAFGSAYLSTLGEMLLPGQHAFCSNVEASCCCHRRYFNWRGERRTHRGF